MVVVRIHRVYVLCTNLGENSGKPLRIGLVWNTDIGQPTQFRVLGEQSERSNSQPIDLDGYQEDLVSSEDNEHFGLSLHGQYH